MDIWDSPPVDIVGDIKAAINRTTNPVYKEPTLHEIATQNLAAMKITLEDGIQWQDAFPCLQTWINLASMSVTFYDRMKIWPTALIVRRESGMIIHSVTT